MTWFLKLTGCEEQSAEFVRKHLYLDGPRLHSRLNGKSWLYGELETPTLAQLREQVRKCVREPSPLSIREVIAHVQTLHRDPSNQHALFQVASQFNLLEMMSPMVTPERGIGIYERDDTQGPACAIAAGPGTIFRNYFVEVNGKIGQTADNQIDCLAGMGKLLGNDDQRLWKMVNGYALPSAEGLKVIRDQLMGLDDASLDRFRESLQIGLQWDTQITLEGASHTVSQAYCSALPVTYTSHSKELWEPFARLVLEASYEATFCAAILNASRTGNRSLYLTLVGGGAFGNDMDWITSAIGRSLQRYSDSGLEVMVCSYVRSQPVIQKLIQDYANRNATN